MDEGRQTIQKFHRDLREAVKSRRRRLNSTLDVKYGRWTPKNKYNIDQVPLPFVVDREKTKKLEYKSRLLSHTIFSNFSYLPMEYHLGIFGVPSGFKEQTIC